MKQKKFEKKNSTKTTIINDYYKLMNKDRT